MRDRDYDDVRRFQRDISEALNSLQEGIHDAFKSAAMLSVGQAMQEMERHKTEAISPASYFDAQQIIHQVSIDEQYRKITEGLVSSIADTRIEVTQRALEGLNIPDYNKSIGEQIAARFSLLSTQEALAGVIQKPLWQVPHSIFDVSASPIRAADQVASFVDSPGFSSALDGIKETLSETLRSETLASARYLATENFLQGRWPDPSAWESIQSTISNFQTNYSGVLGQIEELALDSRVREVVAHANSQGLIESAAELLYQEDFAVEQAEEIVYLGIDSKELISLSPQALQKFGDLVTYLLIALLVAQLNPKFAPDIPQLQGLIMTLAVLYSVRVNQRRLEKELREEDQ